MKRVPKEAQGTPKGPQGSPKGVQSTPKGSKMAPKVIQNGPKMIPNRYPWGYLFGTFLMTCFQKVNFPKKGVPVLTKTPKPKYASLCIRRDGP